MCDNCKTGMRVVEKDMTRDSLTLLTIVQEINSCAGKITAKQLGNICRGKSVTSVYLRKEVTEKHQGTLSHLKEKDLRRLIVKLLIEKVLEE
jgi:superfamily II DNA helicase RecQ